MRRVAQRTLLLSVVVSLALVASSAGAQKFRVLYAFTGGADGSVTQPRAGLIRDSAGNLYGTTSGFGCPTCSDSPGAVFKVDANGTETTLYTFTCGNDGCTPLAAVARDTAGNLYGTTYGDGFVTKGTVFKLDSAGHETTLHAFSGTDGEWLQSRLVLDAKGNLYGTAAYGGDVSCNLGQGCGTVFKVDAAGNFTLLHTFTGGRDGEIPLSGLVRDKQGNLYGTTAYGGSSSACNGGCGTVFKLDRNGKETVLYSFAGGTDGLYPLGDLVLDGKANLYGTTAAGGGTGCPAGCGTIFKLNGKGHETVLYRFAGGSDAVYPEAGLFRDAAGSLYGTTIYGGDGRCYQGCGTVFRLDSAGKETVLHQFVRPKTGYYPTAVLVQDSNGHLYGTTSWGGDLKCAPNQGGGCGVIFEIAP